VGTLTYEELKIITGLVFMSKKYLFSRWLHLFLQVTVFGCSAFLVLVAPTIINSPSSKLLAQKAISQDLEAASFFQQGVMRYNRNDLQGAEYAFRQALQKDFNLSAARNYLGNIFL
jgi:lipoprotein NlpI